jgi:hypothetical protein
LANIVAILTDSTIPKRYWSDLKRKLKVEGNETYEKIVRLKMKAPESVANLFYIRIDISPEVSVSR